MSQKKFLTFFWVGSIKTEAQSFLFFFLPVIYWAVLCCLANYLTFLNLNLENFKILDTFLSRRQWNQQMIQQMCFMIPGKVSSYFFISFGQCIISFIKHCPSILMYYFKRILQFFLSAYFIYAFFLSRKPTYIAFIWWNKVLKS